MQVEVQYKFQAQNKKKKILRNRKSERGSVGSSQKKYSLHTVSS